MLFKKISILNLIYYLFETDRNNIVAFLSLLDKEASVNRGGIGNKLKTES